MTAKKVLRAQRIAFANRLPLVYLVDSAGVFLPLQEDVFPDEDDFGRIFRNNAVISAAGIPQIAAIMGNCVAGGGYLPVLCDKLLMTEGSGLYLAGPALVKSAIGQEVSQRGAGRRGDARPDQRHDRLSRAGRRGVPGAAAAADRADAARRSAAAGALRAHGSGSAGAAGQRSLRPDRARSAGELRSSRRAGLPRRCRQLRRIQGRVRPDARLRHGAASAAFRSASWPTSSIACSRPTGRVPVRRRAVRRSAPRRPPAS